MVHQFKNDIIECFIWIYQCTVQVEKRHKNN